jgi:hypothetical protein
MTNRGYDNNSYSSLSVLDARRWFEPDAETVRLISHEESAGQSKLDIEEVLYALNAFWATLKPVALSLFLASLVCVYINIPIQQGGGMVAYTIDDTSDSDSAKFGKSVANALIIVGFVAFITFALVFLYWMRCMKCLLGYMIFSSSVLLGILGGLLWYTAMWTFDLPCDSVTFFAVLFNFSIVGVMAIFYQTGIPMIITQGYLVATTVILAWNLSKFDEWTCWALLVALAFWDLCAVLTPCGPLQLLVGLMQQRNEPLPGLLYEAQLPPPPEQLTRRHGAPGRGQGQGQGEAAVELTRPAAAAAGTGALLGQTSDDDEHYSSHTDVGAERMFPRRAPHHDGESDGGMLASIESDDQPKLKIPTLGALGLGVGVVGLGMMMAKGKGKDGRTHVASSPSNSAGSLGHYSDVELSDGSVDRSSTALRSARDRDEGSSSSSSRPVAAARPMKRSGAGAGAGSSAASPPTRVAGGANDNQPQGMLIYTTICYTIYGARPRDVSVVYMCIIY